MSFSNNCSKIDKIPGPLKGNPMNGLCEKACIEAKKVFDACIKQGTMQNVTLKMDISTPGEFAEPYKFVSAKSNGKAVLTNLNVTPSAEDPCFARVRADVKIPMDILFVDANGKEGLGLAYLVIPKDVMLHISAPSLTPYEIETVASVVCPEGVFADASTLVVSACTTVILKVTMNVYLLVPTYGYCYIPPCQEYTEEVCDGVFDLPLFPQECGVEGRCKNCP